MQKSNFNELHKMWAPRVETFKASGMSQAEFCRVNKYTKSKFNYWFNKFKVSKNTDQAEKAQWIPVNLPNHNTESLLTVIVGSATIDVKPGFNKLLLAEVVKALSILC